MTCSDFNSYLVITRFIRKERLGVSNHEITQIMQFVDTSFYHSYINIELSSVKHAWILNGINDRTKPLNKINSRSQRTA